MVLASKGEAKTLEVSRATDGGDRSQKGGKSQRATRIVYETTEASIFEHIISESTAMALVLKSEAKAQEEARAPGTEDRNAGLGGASTEKKRFRKKRAKVEREMTLAPNDMEARASGMESEDDALPLSIDEAASRQNDSFTAVHTVRGDEIQRQKVNFFDMSPPSRVVSGMFEISAERSTLPRLAG